MKTQGFTLIELLAVIVILAIIALIATPIVLGIIEDTKKSSQLRSAEFYLDGVEQAVMRENMNSGGNFRPTICTITKEGNLDCTEKDGILEIEVDGEKPIDGKIQFHEGKIKNVTLKYQTAAIVLNDDGSLLYKDEYVEWDFNISWTESHDGDYYFERQSNDRNSNDYYTWKTINNNEEYSSFYSTFMINVPQEIEYTFDWSMYDIECTDWLEIYLNGNYVAEGYGGEISESVTITLEEGENTLSVSYNKQSNNGNYASVTLKDVIVNGHNNIKTDEMLAHEYDDGKITKEHSCTEYGELTYTCVCGKTRTEVINKHTDNTHDSICDICNESLGGLYDENYVLIASWDELTNKYGLNVQGSYASNQASGTMNSVLKNNPELSNGTKVIIPNTVTAISMYAFSSCSNLTSIAIPNSVKSLGTVAFAGCGSLKSIYIPESVTSFGTGRNLFEGCESLETIVVDENNPKYDSRNNCNAIIETATNKLMVGSIKTIIPDGVISIEAQAFYRRKYLKSIVIPDSVKTIGWESFAYCPNLVSVEISNGVTKIDGFAFQGCKKLTNINIPDSVTNIGNSSFSSCSSLKSIEIPDSVTSIGQYIFSSCEELETVKMSKNIRSIPYRAFWGCKSLKSIEIPDGVTSIGEQAFTSCTNLISVKMSKNITSIGDEAFSSCSSLKSIEIPDSVTSIGEDSFRYCESIKTVVIPANVTTIGYDAFWGCDNLESVYFEHTTAPKFGRYSFYKYSGNPIIFYFKNSTVADAFTTTYYNSTYGQKSTNYDW